MNPLLVIMFCYVLLYFILAGQAVFYKFCFTQVFGLIPAQQFVSIRKLADPILAKRLAVVYYSSLVLGLVIIVMACLNATPAFIILSALTFVMLVADVFLARKYNIPLNSKINALASPTETISHELQSEWLKWIDIRGNFIVVGFILLIIQLVFF